jgi:hypothetical protein
MIDPKKFNKQAWIIGALRRASYRYPPRYTAKLEARRERGKYECSSCHQLYGPKQVQLDHRNPVVDPTKGFTGWQDYIERMFADFGEWDVMCKPCHKIKTSKENAIRKALKPKKPKKKKEKLTNPKGSVKLIE